MMHYLTDGVSFYSCISGGWLASETSQGYVHTSDFAMQMLVLSMQAGIVGNYIQFWHL